MTANKTEWDWKIKNESSWAGTSLQELVSYKDLLFRLVRKEFLTSFQQTLLGPFWIVIQPLLTVLTYVLVFNKVIRISTEGIPPFLYYLIGITLWNLFSELLLTVSYAFTQNVAIFNKVYFPRILAPLSMLLLNGLRFGIHLVLLFAVLLYCWLTGQFKPDLSHLLLAIPAIIVTSGIAFGAGLIFSILTGKYKDLFGLLQLVIRLLMFVCPIFFSLAMVPEKLKSFVWMNPLSSVFELFRYSIIGRGHTTVPQFMYSFVCMLVLVVGGVLLFNKKSDELMDVA